MRGIMRGIIRILGLCLVSHSLLYSHADSVLSEWTVASSDSPDMTKTTETTAPTDPTQSTATPYTPDTSDGIKATTQSQRLKPKMRIAICLTGQLLRLEVLSKIRHLIAYNTVHMGHKVDVFVLLDNNITEAKQTYWRHDYSNSIYRNMTSASLKQYFDRNILQAVTQLQQDASARHNNLYPISVRVVLAPPVQGNYTILGGTVPVGDKTGPPPAEGLPTVGDFEPAALRFQNNMRWLGGLRSCVKWVQQTEQQQQWFYDIVVRLRDDSYLLAPWPIADSYRGAFVTASISSAFGVNDHNFAVDRRYADPVLRGVTEDYYFNETLDFYTWTNTEHRIFKVLTSKNIPIRLMDVCEYPVAHLRGMMNGTHWRLHPTYTETMLQACDQAEHDKMLEEERLEKLADAAAAGGVSVSDPHPNPNPDPTLESSLRGFFGLGGIGAILGGKKPTHRRLAKKARIKQEAQQVAGTARNGNGVDGGDKGDKGEEGVGGGVRRVRPCCVGWMDRLESGAVTVTL